MLAIGKNNTCAELFEERRRQNKLVEMFHPREHIKHFGNQEKLKVKGKWKIDKITDWLRDHACRLSRKFKFSFIHLYLYKLNFKEIFWKIAIVKFS